MEKLLLTPPEAAALIGIGRTRVYDLIARGVLPSLRIGRSVRVPVEGLREWIEFQRAANGNEIDNANRPRTQDTSHARKGRDVPDRRRP